MQFITGNVTQLDSPHKETSNITRYIKIRYNGTVVHKRFYVWLNF